MRFNKVKVWLCFIQPFVSQQINSSFQFKQNTKKKPGSFMRLNRYTSQSQKKKGMKKATERETNNVARPHCATVSKRSVTKTF